MTSNYNRNRAAIRMRLGAPLCAGLLLLNPWLARAKQGQPQQPASGQPAAQKTEDLNADRKKQIADESARLLKLATDLKVEVDKTTKDTLSLNVIRKADEIEKLAHTVKEQMRPAAGPN
jgi:nitric oxide reductase activation protein